jgi:SAM-dependent methyltransferase
MPEPPPYAPGWGTEVLTMLSARTADDRAAFVLPSLRDGLRLLDVGCGPGTITVGLARRVAPTGSVVGVDMEPSQIELAQRAARDAAVANAVFRQAMADALPFDDASFDVVFAHALFEHLAAPVRVLNEMHRVLRPGGLLAACSSDWGGARVEPRTRDVQLALEAHYALRRRAGGDPSGGARLREWVAATGFVVQKAGVDERADMTYSRLAEYVEGRIHAALGEIGEAGAEASSPAGTAPSIVMLSEAAEAASRWVHGGAGTFVQRWAYVLARRGVPPSEPRR